MEKDKTKKGQFKNYTPHEVPSLTKEDVNDLASSALLIGEYSAFIHNTYVDIPGLNTRKLNVSKSGGKKTYVQITQ